ncbi:methyltransferase [Candidatus Woesearchaeota archaeon]|nr:methyltransferase [Candidatus Woesearchaeota archaeon]
MNPKKLESIAITSLSSLAVALSHLRVFDNPQVKLEQHHTDSQVAAELLWNAKLQGDIENKTIADLGCGTGLLGIGALLLGAKKVFLVDVDLSALKIAEESLKMLKLQRRAAIVNKPIAEFAQPVDVVIQNPPFGTKSAHADRDFLFKAFELASTVYSMHKESTASFIHAVAGDHGMRITHHWRFAFPLKAIHEFHRKRVQRIDVGAWRFERKMQAR